MINNYSREGGDKVRVIARLYGHNYIMGGKYVIQMKGGGNTFYLGGAAHVMLNVMK